MTTPYDPDQPGYDGPSSEHGQPNGYGQVPPGPNQGSAPPQPGYGQGYGPPTVENNQGYSQPAAGDGQGYGPPPPGYGPPQPPPGYGPPQPPPGYGPPSPPGHGQGYGPASGYQTYGQPGGEPGYTHPGYGPGQYGRPLAPKPGIIALRPLGIGDILDGAFKAMRFNPKVMFGLTALVLTVQVALQVGLLYLFTSLMRDTVGAYDDPNSVEAQLNSLTGQSASLGASSLAQLIFGAILAGLLIIPVSRAILGERISLNETWNAGKTRIWGLIALSFIITLIVIVAIAVFTIPVVFMFIAGDNMIVGAILGTILALLAILAGAFYLVVRTLFAAPALVLEEIGPIKALRRGWVLSRGRFWRTLGIYLIISFIVGLISNVISVPVTFLASMSSFMTDAASIDMAPLYVATVVAGFVSGLITSPFLAGATALLYTDARMRDEGLDIALTKAASTLP